jgi:hypothetical protein
MKTDALDLITNFKSTSLPGEGGQVREMFAVFADGSAIRCALYLPDNDSLTTAARLFDDLVAELKQIPATQGVIL